MGHVGDQRANVFRRMTSFYRPHGFAGPDFFMALMAQRHMHLYGARREACGEVAITSRRHATTQPGARRRDPLSLEDYRFESRAAFSLSYSPAKIETSCVCPIETRRSVRACSAPTAERECCSAWLSQTTRSCGFHRWT